MSNIQEYYALLNDLKSKTGSWKSIRFEPHRKFSSEKGQYHVDEDHISEFIESAQIEIERIGKWGKPVSACMCRLWRGRCSSECWCHVIGGGIFDHIQMYKRDKNFTFVSEPYYNNITTERSEFGSTVPRHIKPEHQKRLSLLGRLYGLSVEIDTKKSSWYPGSTVSIIFKTGDRLKPNSCCKTCNQRDDVWKCIVFGTDVYGKSNEHKWCTEYVAKEAQVKEKNRKNKFIDALMAKGISSNDFFDKLKVSEDKYSKVLSGKIPGSSRIYEFWENIIKKWETYDWDNYYDICATTKILTKEEQA